MAVDRGVASARFARCGEWRIGLISVLLLLVGTQIKGVEGQMHATHVKFRKDWTGVSFGQSVICNTSKMCYSNDGVLRAQCELFPLCTNATGHQIFTRVNLTEENRLHLDENMTDCVIPSDPIQGLCVC